jgi:signal transduction histidine kinase
MNTTLNQPDYQAFDLMLEGIQVIDYNWHFTYANHTVTMQGIFNSELIGRSVMEVYPNIRHTQLFMSFQLCMVERNSQQLSFEMAYPGQAVSWFDFYVIPVEEGIFVLSRNKSGNNEAITHKVNWEYPFQSQERETRINELLTANREIIFQNQEKKNRADELLIANIELSFQQKEKKDRADELLVANTELCFQQKEKDKRAEELVDTLKGCVSSENQLAVYIKGLKDMMFVISHKLRQPVANILGISNQLEGHVNSPPELMELIDYIKKSATALDAFTEELTKEMNEIGAKCASMKGRDQKQLKGVRL